MRWRRPFEGAVRGCRTAIWTAQIPAFMAPERLPSDEYRALGHPARRRIVELLGTRDSISFSELRAETGLPVGTLYYHLDVLRGLVTQDEGRRYLLSKEGKKVYASLADKEGLPQPKASRALSFLPGWLFARLERGLPAAAAVWLLVAAIGSLASGYAGQSLVLMHFAEAPSPVELGALLFPVSMVIYMAYNLACSYAIAGRGTSFAGLLASGPVCAPYVIFPLAAIAVGGLDDASLRLIFLVLAVIVQGASVTLGAAYVSSTYGMRLERSLLLQLLYYVGATVIFSGLQYAGFIAEAWVLV
jgi:DNA-binding transcriptional ArsR family regulator